MRESRTVAAPAKDRETVPYELSSTDEAVEWHLHARDGELLCVLPCERTLDERSGAYLAVHNPNKSWRVDLPNAPTTTMSGAHVSIEVREGKGTPALGTLGIALGVVGAASATIGIGLVLSGFISIIEPSGAYSLLAGAGLIGGGALVGVPGVWLTEHNRAASVRVRFVGNSVVGSF